MPAASEDVMEISNPRRVLIVGMEDQALHLSRVVKGERCLSFLLSFF